MLKLYGIKNCDTVKKARNWLKENCIEYEFIDFREQGIDKILLSAWINQMGLDAVINKRSTSWRSLDDSQKDNINDKNALDLITAMPTLIKRPVVSLNDKILLGFDSKKYHALFN